jgi:hypothetical protein
VVSSSFHPEMVEGIKEKRRAMLVERQWLPHEFPMPWGSMGTTSVLVLYLVSQLYLVLEVFSGMRERSASALPLSNWAGTCSWHCE